MIRHCEWIIALLIFVFPARSSAQSLGDVARQIRAERKANPHARVITNDDIPSTKTAPADRVETQAAGSSENADKQAGDETASNKDGSEKSRKTPEKERAAQELEKHKRTQELSQVYLDRIAAVRAQISKAQAEMAKLQQDQIESTIEFQRSVGTSPSIPVYERQQRSLIEQIEARRSLIDDLNSQLEDAQEAARHAGVPHVYD